YDGRFIFYEPGWLPRSLNDGGYIRGFVLPLWIPVVAFAVPSAFLWVTDWRKRRRPGHCSTCNYDRPGLAPDAPCPECGKTPEPGVLLCAILPASSIAARMLPGSALFIPAMSKAVPWSGLVRGMGRPTVMFTARSRSSSFSGIRPWSWYIA